ncbi:MAG: S49 family peptidase [Actinobacteria bacterium]|nr:S49 family peptidase [Actinomycetota bacterium]
MSAVMHRYERQGLLALNPQALGQMFPETAGATMQTAGSVAVVPIRGPLEQNRGRFSDSYESILERVSAACASTCSTVILQLNSPGGDVYGLFDTARAIRARCDAAGKTLLAYVEGEACSAGYALACAASEIIVADTSFVGSIGVLETRVDLTTADAQTGVRFAITTSGARKADMHMHVTLSDGERAAAQARVDSLAAVFFDFVAANRPLEATAVQALQAALFHGPAAVAAGLADRVASFDAVLALVASGGTAMPPEDKEEKPTAGGLDDAKAALEKLAEGDGPDADKARAALKILNAADDDESEGDEASSSDSDESDDKEPKAKPSASASSSDLKLAQEVQKLSRKVAKYEAEREQTQRAAIFASRPDLSPELVKTIESEPLEKIKAIIASIPVATGKKLAASSFAQGHRGTSQSSDGQPTPQTDDDDDTEHNPLSTSRMDTAFGLPSHRSAISRNGNRKNFGVMDREDARAAQAAASGKGAAK